jgi:hypothetical protein
LFPSFETPPLAIRPRLPICTARRFELWSGYRCSIIKDYHFLALLALRSAPGPSHPSHPDQLISPVLEELKHSPSSSSFSSAIPSSHSPPRIEDGNRPHAGSLQLSPTQQKARLMEGTQKREQGLGILDNKATDAQTPTSGRWSGLQPCFDASKPRATHVDATCDFGQRKRPATDPPATLARTGSCQSPIAVEYRTEGSADYRIRPREAKQGKTKGYAFRHRYDPIAIMETPNREFTYTRWAPSRKWLFLVAIAEIHWQLLW